MGEELIRVEPIFVVRTSGKTDIGFVGTNPGVNSGLRAGREPAGVA